VSARGPVVLVGGAADAHVAAMDASLRGLGVVPVVLDTLRFPEETRLSLGPSLDDVRLAGAPLGRPAAVYLRGLHASPIAFDVDAEAEMAEDWRTTLVAFREKAEFLIALLLRWEEMGVPIYNPLGPADRLRKPFQVARLAEAGFPVPATLWSNDPGEVRTFAAAHGRVAYKPVAGGAATRELTPADLDEARLAALAGAPVTFQELLPGEDLRVFVLDDAVVAAFRITTSALDYRQNEERVEGFSPDPALADTCRRAARLLGLRFTGMDLKRAADGTLRILELNPSPMFLGFDALAGTDVRGALARALAAHAAAAV
jgi:glutathione synthase/RimK-type ligase-like ATP-grasp enzyme